jgi:ABC-type transport system substrate-binding protein
MSLFVVKLFSPLLWSHAHMPAKMLFSLVLALTLVQMEHVSASEPAVSVHKESGNSSALVYGDWRFPSTLNALRVRTDVESNLVELTSLPLVSISDTGALIPMLLQSVPSAANGGIRDHGKTIVLALRPHMRWSSGVEVTNRDVLFGWRIAMDPITGPSCRGTCDHIRSVTLQGRYTVILHLQHAFGPLLRIGLPPVFPRAWRRLGGNSHRAAYVLSTNERFDYLNASYWTDGPYQVRSYEKDNYIAFTAMRYFHLRSEPHVHALTFRFYPSKLSLMAAVPTGKVDVAGGFTAADLPYMKSQGLRGKIRLQPSLALDHVEFNVRNRTYLSKPNPVASRLVRQALALVTNRPLATATALGLEGHSTTTFLASGPLLVPFQLRPRSNKPIPIGNWDPLQGKYVTKHAIQIQDARTLLSNAGWTQGFTLDLRVDPHDPLQSNEAQSLTVSWAEIGVHVRLVPISECFPCTSDADLYTGAFEAALVTAHLGLDAVSITPWVGSRFINGTTSRHSSSNLNFSGIDDRVIDAALHHGSTTLNSTQRALAYWKLQTRMVKQAYWLPLFFRPSVATVSPRIIGFTGHPDSSSLLWNAARWTLSNQSNSSPSGL